MANRKAFGSKGDLERFREEIVHEFHVVMGRVMDQVKLVADGVATVNEKLERTRKELKEEIDNKTRPIAKALLELNGKLSGLGGKVD